MEKLKIKHYCQFCLKDQDGIAKVPINDEIRRIFSDLTHIDLNTSQLCSNICPEPCLTSLNQIIDYRDTLVKNQQILSELFESPDAEYLELKAEEESLLEEPTECTNCSELVGDFESHVCFLEKLEDEDEVESSLELDALELKDKAKVTKKKYAKKKLKEPISCPMCQRLFYYKEYLRFHYKDVHENQETVCQFCGKIFKNSRRLNSHVVIHQTESEKKYKCDQCPKQFHSSGDLSRHKLVHSDVKPHTCHICLKGFSQSYALKLHIDVHNRVKFTCDMCSARFSAKRTLKKHMDKCMKGIATVRAQSSRLNRSENISNREKYKCISDGCDRQFTSRQYLGVHLEKYHGMKYDNFETTCLECNLVFSSFGEYSVHIRQHSCNFVCDLCKLRFRTEEKLRSHVEKAHKEGEDRPYICPELGCGGRFKRAEHLRSHHQHKHSDERKIECSYCELKFHQRGAFNVHMRIHTASKPFSCWRCEHVCKTSSNLRQHMLLVHGEVNIYLCKICQQTFKYSTDLTQHRKQHSTSTVDEVEVNREDE